MPGPDFAGRRTKVFLLALTYHCTLKSSTNHQQICLSFSWTQPTLQKYLQVPTYKTHYTTLNSYHVSKLSVYLFMLETEKTFANKKKRRERIFTEVYI